MSQGGVGTRSRPRKGRSLGTFTATAYGPPWGGIQGEGSSTACGAPLNGKAPKIYAVAAPPSMPCGQLLYIWPNPFGHRGPFLVWDRGGAITEGRLDFYDWRGRRTQDRWGRRQVKVWEAVTSSGAHAELTGLDWGKMFQGQGWATPLAPLEILGEAAKEGIKVPTPDIPGVKQGAEAINGLLAPLESVANFATGLGELLLTPPGWVRLGKILFGSIAVLWGVHILVRQQTGVDVGAGVKKAAEGAVALAAVK